MQFYTHTFVYLLEVLIVTKVITYFIGTTGNQPLFTTFKDYVFAYTLYQLFLLITFKLSDSLVVDGYTSIKTLLDRLQLYGEFDEKVPEELTDKIKKI
ncbi:hypothetical protein KEH51_05220 [[Brevibacterium] frigoritolerans]|uniref:Uncharacterized protein n=1 Tax=Peribacillus frigoritolerans TaxID=450367 RepID=A0A941FK47_9BACI|nr:hypothetical protein [Peribacillus frigoritolerans]